MKQSFKLFILFFSISAVFASCIKNDDTVFTQPLVEIDWSTYNARTSGYPFPLLTRVPQEPGRGVITSNLIYGTGAAVTDPVLSRTYTDTIRMRINLVGPQMSTAQTFQMRVAQEFTTGKEGSATTPGAHFELIDKTVTIPANQSFGFARWVVRNPGPTNNLPVNVVFQLVGNGAVPVNENYQYIGWSITQ